MKRALAVAAMVVAGCAPLGGTLRESPDAQALAAAEGEFAAQSVREDMRRAFLAHFAADGVFVRGTGWVNARATLEPSTAPPIVLDWHPAYTEVAASGELGLSTGPWTITRKDNPAAPPLYGQFVSVWRREADNAWRVIVDLGVDHPQPALADAPLQAVAPPGPGAAHGDDVDEAERRFAADATALGAREAYTRWSSPRIRFYRQGAAPLIGLDTVLSSSPAEGPPIAWRIEKAETARSRDFGYARGSFAAPGEAEPRGFFLRVWHREPEGWRIILTVANPIPQ